MGYRVLNWIGGNKVDHPMADPKKAREIVDDLPGRPPIKALEEATEWLESIHTTEAFKVERRYELLDLIDTACRMHPRKLLQEYLGMQRAQKFQENRLYTTMYGFLKATSDGYLDCVNQCESLSAAATIVRKHQPQSIGRALRALGLQVKWALMRYGPVESRVWEQVGRLYQSAEAAGLLEQVIELYPGRHGRTTLRQEFLRSAMLAASSTDGLTPTKQHVAERVVSHFSPMFVLSQTVNENMHFAIDVASGRAPQRLRAGQTGGGTIRFFGAGEAYEALRALRGTVNETGALPSDMDLGGVQENEILTTVFLHLEQYWAETPPARHSERRHMVTRMTVVHGLSEIFNALGPKKQTDGLDFSGGDSVANGDAAESWLVENVSDGGFGAIIPGSKSDWLRVGALIGVLTETAQHWGIGIVRRVTRDEQQQRRVGIQLLTRTALPIHLAGGSLEQSEQAILLATSPDRQGEIGVVMKDSVYNSRDSLEMTVNGKTFLLMPSRLVEGGEDFDWAKFKVMQRS